MAWELQDGIKMNLQAKVESEINMHKSKEKTIVQIGVKIVHKQTTNNPLQMHHNPNLGGAHNSPPYSIYQWFFLELFCCFASNILKHIYVYIFAKYLLYKKKIC